MSINLYLAQLAVISMLFFIGGFFFGRAYQLRYTTKQLRKVLNDVDDDFKRIAKQAVSSD